MALKLWRRKRKRLSWRSGKSSLTKWKKVSLSAEKGKAKRTRSEEVCEEFEKELRNLSPLKEEMVKPSRKIRKVTIIKKVLREQFTKRWEGKEKKDHLGKNALTEEEDKDLRLGDKNAHLSTVYVSINFKVEKGLFPFKGGLPIFLEVFVRAFK